MNNNILQENNKLHEKIKYLKNELNSVYDVIDKHLANEIIEHINKTNSIKLTANYYKIDPDWIYCKIPEWDDCNDRLYSLDDYEYHNYKIYGRENELYDSFETLLYNDKDEYKKMQEKQQKEAIQNNLRS